ncbi:MAG: hypothetical protein V9G19_06535 [Tetrasphaera sp.]
MRERSSVDGSGEVDHDAVAHDVGGRAGAGEGPVVLVQNEHDRVGRAEVDADLDPTAGTGCQAVPGEPCVMLGEPCVIEGEPCAAAGRRRVILGHPPVAVGHRPVVVDDGGGAPHHFVQAGHAGFQSAG